MKPGKLLKSENDHFFEKTFLNIEKKPLNFKYIFFRDFCHHKTGSIPHDAIFRSVQTFVSKLSFKMINFWVFEKYFDFWPIFRLLPKFRLCATIFFSQNFYFSAKIWRLCQNLNLHFSAGEYFLIFQSLEIGDVTNAKAFANEACSIVLTKLCSNGHLRKPNCEEEKLTSFKKLINWIKMDQENVTEDLHEFLQEDFPVPSFTPRCGSPSLFSQSLPSSIVCSSEEEFVIPILEKSNRKCARKIANN